MSQTYPIEKVINVDEIGLQTARLGDCVIVAHYQPVFAVRGELLVPVAMHGSALAWMDSEFAPLERCRAESVEDQHVQLLSTVLQIRNLAIAGFADLRLVIELDLSTLDASTTKTLIRRLGTEAENAGTASRQLLFKLSRTGDWKPADIASIMQELNRLGFLIAPSLETIDRMVPLARENHLINVVSADARRYPQMAMQSPVQQLFGQLVRQLHESSRQILVDGIMDAGTLEFASAANADFMAGDFLGSPQPAGTAFDRSDRSLSDLLDRQAQPSVSDLDASKSA